MTEPAYCLAHGLITLHVRTEAGDRILPAALTEGATGEHALLRAGPRARRVVRWDEAGWATWWALLAQLAGSRLAVAAVPPLEQNRTPPLSLSNAHIVPPAVAVRAATPLLQGTALYAGVFGWEVAPFGPQGMDKPARSPSGLEPLYRGVIATFFRQERRALLPVQVPALLKEGFQVDVTGAVEEIVPLLGEGPAVLGGEDEAIVATLVEALTQRGYKVTIVNPLDGLERLVWAAGGLW